MHYADKDIVCTVYIYLFPSGTVLHVDRAYRVHREKKQCTLCIFGSNLKKSMTLF